MKTTLLILISILVAISARADLTATVTPGYTYSSTERPTTSTLNRLGLPSITISGTIGGTNAGLAAGSVNGSHLVDTFVDGTNITWNTASPRALKIVDAGVNVVQLSASVAGFGLSGGAGEALKLNVDTNTITFSTTNSDFITLATNLSPARIVWTTNTLIGASGYFTNAPITLPTGWSISGNALTASVATKYAATNAMPAAGGLATFTHGLAGNPQVVKLSLVCTNNDAATSWVAGDEIDLAGFTSADVGTLAVVYTSATDVRVVFNGSSTMQVLDKSSGLRTSVTSRNNFILKCAAAYLP